MEIKASGSGRSIATLVNFSCHPEALWSDNRLITADFPGYLCSAIETSRGGIALYVNGALGGMVTVDVRTDGKGRETHSFGEAKRIGAALAMKALEALDKGKDLVIPWIKVHRKEVAIPAENWRFRLAKRLGVIQRSLKAKRVLTEVWYINLGDVQIITVPGEILPDLGLRLKAHMRGKYQFLFGLANDELGYILLEEDYDDDLYKYERSMSVGPEAGFLIYKELIDLFSPEERQLLPSPPDRKTP